MPAKIICPYSPEQLRAVYAAKSLRQIAADLTANGYPVSIKTVSGWLEEAGIERKVFSPYSAGKIESPLTPARLQELYWRDGKSTSEIGALAATEKKKGDNDETSCRRDIYQKRPRV